MFRLFDYLDSIAHEYHSSYDNKTKDKIYYEDGLVSRLDGPAIIREDGSEEYYYKGKQVTKEFIENKRHEIEMNNPHYISIDGKVTRIKGEKYLQIKQILEE